MLYICITKYTYVQHYADNLRLDKALLKNRYNKVVNWYFSKFSKDLDSLIYSINCSVRHTIVNPNQMASQKEPDFFICIILEKSLTKICLHYEVNVQCIPVQISIFWVRGFLCQTCL